MILLESKGAISRLREWYVLDVIISIQIYTFLLKLETTLKVHMYFFPHQIVIDLCPFMVRHPDPRSTSFFKCQPSGRRHQPTFFKIHASVHVQFRPMALLSSWRQPLCQASVRKFLQGTVNPSEAQCFFHNIEVGQYARRGSLAPAHDNPALLFLGVVFLQPGSELRTSRQSTP